MHYEPIFKKNEVFARAVRAANDLFVERGRRKRRRRASSHPFDDAV